MRYGHSLCADTMYTIDNFIDGYYYTKKVNVTEKSNCMCFLLCWVHQQCTAHLRLVGGHIEIFVTFGFDPLPYFKADN